MRTRNPIHYLIENAIILLLVAYKKDKEVLKEAFALLTQEKWYEHFPKSHLDIGGLIKECVATFQKREYEELHDIFIKNTHIIQREVASEHYHLYTLMLEAIVSIHPDDKGENRLLEYHKTVFEFIKPRDISPMFTLSYQRFYQYIEALIIYAAIDNLDFNLHQNESMLILNEIRSYIKHKPMEDVNASEIFFPILDIAKKRSKNHISTRFEGLVKANLKVMNDEQDAYFLAKLEELSRVDGVHSVQERLFDSIIATSLSKVEPYQKREREGLILLQELSMLRVPFSMDKQLVHNVLARLPSSDEEAILLLWKWIEKAIIEHFSKYNILDVTKKSLFILQSEGRLEVAQYEYLLRIRSFTQFTQYINFDAHDASTLKEAMATVYVFFKRAAKAG